MANLTKNVGTVTLAGVAEKVTLPASYGWVWVKNMSEGDIFAGLSADISEGADGAMVIPSGECGRIQADGFRSVWLLGTGNALVVAQNYADCPFKSGGKGGELPVASTDTLGGVMVDGTSITADEQGVISSVGGGGLTLMGTYEIPANTPTIIGNIKDFPEGTKLMFERVPTEYNTNSYSLLNELNSYTRNFGYVPFLSKGYDKAISGCWFNASGGTSVNKIQITIDKSNNIYVFIDWVSNTWNIYKVEV